MAKIAVHVTPRSGRDEIVGWRGDELAVRVRAVPDSGQANRAVCKLLAARLGVPASGVRIARGGTARHKLVEVLGLDAAAVEAGLGRPAQD